ncbi:MAG: flagellar assembly protein FliX, partial [Asticcacaulis sp.]|nr:flagellar assembly protein FliX [Asticcacaulis sp.]
MTFKINSATGMTVPSAAGGLRRTGGDFSLGKASSAPRSAATAQASAALGMMGV